MKMPKLSFGVSRGDGGRPVLVDPENRDNQIAPSDRKNPTRKEPSSDEHADVELVLQRFKDAGNARRAVERDWVLACAFREGRQWMGWDDATHKVINLMDEDERERYITDDLIGPLIDKVIALATMTKPDANVAPDSDAPRDRQAASEARMITSHLYRLNGNSRHTQEVATWAAVCGVGYSLERWDKSRYADIPKFGPDGQPVGKVSARVGEAQSHIVSPFELFVDPQAKRWDDALWVIRAKVQPLSWFQEQYPGVGDAVEPDQRDAQGGYVDAYVTGENGGPSALSDFFRGGAKNKAALLLEMWEKPTPRYPRGRFIAVAGKRRLTPSDCAWPTKPGVNGGFPFARCVYKEAIGHPYGRGLVVSLAPLQVGYNRLLSRVVERIEQDKLTVAIAKGSNVGADAYDDAIDEGRNIRKVYFDADMGAPPGFQSPPPVTGDVWRLKDSFWMDMQHIAGVHEVNMGGTPPGVTAGISIDLLQQGDKTQLGLFTSSIEQYAVQRDVLRIGLYAQYASPDLPRLMGLDETGNPDEARSRALAFRALTSGGSCQVIVQPGSATPKSPAGQQQEVMEYFAAKLFGEPGTPEAGYMAVKLLNLSRSDEVLDFLRLQMEQKASQPNPAQLELLKQQAAMGQAQSAQQHQAEMAAIQAHIATQAAGAAPSPLAPGAAPSPLAPGAAPSPLAPGAALSPGVAPLPPNNGGF